MIKTYREAVDKLFKIEIIEDYNLDNIRKWVSLLWNPQDSYKIIHVAWTNGKGSVCKMVFSILKNNLKKVWVFTSPHLIDIKERFETDTWNITEREFINIFNKILKLNLKLSYFDKCVLIALEFFKLRKCEYVILEVWVWWKFDTTNIVNPIITAIISIWYDHQGLLWNTLKKISEEKAGIIKKNIPVVVNIKNKIIEEKALKENSEIIFTNKKIKTNLSWDFQEKNAAIAYEISKFLKIDESKIIDWLQKVKHRWRLEFVSDNLLIDWAHNIDSLKELKKFIEQNLENKFKKIFYCFSIKKWKKINLVLNIFWKNKNYILVDVKSDMLENMEEYTLRKDFFGNKKNFSIKTVSEIIFESEKNKKNLYVVFWSLYMIWNFL